MRDIVAIMLWEQSMLMWRGFLLRLGITLALCAVPVLVFENQAHVSEMTAIGLRSWIHTIAALALLSTYNLGQQNIEGFPFRVGFSHPVPNWLLVLIPMGFKSVACWLMYFIPIALGKLVYDMPPFVLLGSLAIIPVTLICLAASWWSTSKGPAKFFSWTLAYLFVWVFLYYFLHFHEDAFLDDVDGFFWTYTLYPVDYLAFVAVSVAAVAVTVAGVIRQRHGETGIGLGSTGKPVGADWFAELYMTNCPTRNARLAELWAEIMSRTMPALVWSLIIAACLPSLWLISNLADSEIAWWLSANLITVPFILCTPTFGVHLRNGTAHVSTFDATRPVSIGWLTTMKLGVSFVGLTLGVAIIGASAWLAAPLVQGFIEPLLIVKHFLIDYFRATSGIELVASLFVLSVRLLALLALLAAIQALYVLFADVLSIGLFALIFYVSGLIILVGTGVLPTLFGEAHIYLGTLMVIVAVVYLGGDLLRRRILGIGELLGVIVFWLLFVIACVYGLFLDGYFSAGAEVFRVALYFGMTLTPLLVFFLAPWSLAVTRHQ